MRCPACSEYVPEGLGFTNCPSCNADLSAAILSTTSFLREPNKPEVSQPKLQPPKASIKVDNSVTRVLFDFAYKRSLRGAIGFWLSYTLVGLIIAILFGIVEYILFKRHVPPVFGIQGANFLGAAECLLLGILILKNKNGFVLNVLIAATSIIAALFKSPSFGILVLAFLTMRRSSKGITVSMPRAKLPIVIIITVLILLFAGIAGVYALKAGVSFHSYYIDNDQTVGRYMPDNRFFQMRGQFFTLMINYPQDMYRPILGMEVFVQRVGATHFLKLSVNENNSNGLPVRFRIKKMILKDGDQSLPFLLFQSNLYKDKLHQAAAGKPPSEKSARLALDQSTELLSRLDFSATTSTQELFFGYFLTRPPKELRLEFEIQVYGLGGEPKETVSEAIELQRVDKDPYEWINNEMRRRR